MKLSCPVCDGPASSVFRKNEADVCHCDSCRHRWAGLQVDPTHTAVHYDDDYFTDGNDGYVDYLGDGALVRDRGRWYAKLLERQHIAAGRVLDVGAAAGFFLQGLQDHGWSGVGLEPNGRMAKFGREQLRLDVREGTLESLSLDEPFDLVSIIQVVAHLTDPAQAFRAAARHTRPGGHWIIETWNYRSLSARLMGRSWHEYSPPRTLHWFCPDSIRALANQCGMEFVASGRPDKSISAEHAKSLLKHSTAGNRIVRAITSPAMLIPDRVRIPYPANDLNWFLFRKRD